MKFSEYFSFCEIVTYKEHLIFLQISNRNDFFQSELKLFYFLDLRKLQYQVKKAFSYKKLFWPFTVWINCSMQWSQKFCNFSAFSLESKIFSQTLEQFFLTVGQKFVTTTVITFYIRFFFLIFWWKMAKFSISIREALNGIRRSFHKTRLIYCPQNFLPSLFSLT